MRLKIVLLTIMAVFLFMGGYHNIDLAFNMANAPTCMDYNGVIFQTKETIYLIGQRLMLLGFAVLIVLIFSLNPDSKEKYKF